MFLFIVSVSWFAFDGIVRLPLQIDGCSTTLSPLNPSQGLQEAGVQSEATREQQGQRQGKEPHTNVQLV